MNVKQRFIAPTPDFWKKVRNYTFFGGLVLAGLTQGIATAGISIPLLTTILTVSGVTLSFVGGGLSQLTIDDKTVQSPKQEYIPPPPIKKIVPPSPEKILLAEKKRAKRARIKRRKKRLLNK